MKLIIDAYQYSPSITGTDRMAYNFLVQLQKIDKENSFIVLCSREKYTRSSIKSSNFKTVTPPLICKAPFLGKYFSYAWRRATKIFLILLNADVYFSFHNMALPGRRLAKKMIASNLDLIPITLDDYKNIGRNTPEEQLEEYKRVAKLADHFVSISEYSKNELRDLIGVPENKISVVHLAADESFLDSAKYAKKRLVKDDYIFTMGGSEPRKNVQNIIFAYNRLSKKIQGKYKLVIAGGKWHGINLKETENKNIIELGYVADQDLPSLYRHSSSFVFASSYEGFGFTILEAMACSTPVINARGSSLDEVAGKATLTFDPQKPNELVKRIENLLENKKIQKNLIKLGHEQSKKFSWEKSSDLLYQILTK